MPTPEHTPQQKPTGTIDSQPRGAVRQSIQSLIKSERLPAYGASAYYGVSFGKIDGNWVLQWKGKNRLQTAKTTVDIFGDDTLRKFDYHMPSNSLKLLIRKPAFFLGTLLRSPKAHRGSATEVWQEIKRLQLDRDNIYSPYPPYDGREDYATYERKINGILLDTELVEKSPTLWDIIVAHRGDIPAEDLRQIDRFDAYRQAASYKADMDRQFGYGGMDGPWSIFFRKVNATTVGEPISNIPDVLPNRNKVTAQEYQATTLAMFAINIIVEELKMNDGDPRRAANTLIEAYGNPKIIKLMAYYMRRGRLTLPGDNLDQLEAELKETELKSLANIGKNPSYADNGFNRILRKIGSFHNTTSMRVESDKAVSIRKTIIQTCDDYLNRATSSVPPIPSQPNS